MQRRELDLGQPEYPYCARPRRQCARARAGYRRSGPGPGSAARRNSVPEKESLGGVRRGRVPRPNFGRRTLRALSCHRRPCDGAPAAGIDRGGDWYGSFSAPAAKEKRRKEVEGSYKRGPIHVRAEQIWARDGRLERRGGYALGAWRLSPHWGPLARTDWLTTGIHKANTTYIAYLAGLDFYWGKDLK